jgi:hypothetical protein
MKPLQSSFPLLALATAIFVAPVVYAQAAPPAGATGICKDGTYTTSASKGGACHGHQGVKEWLATPSTTPAASTAPAAKAEATPAKPAKPVTAAPVAPASTAAASAAQKAPTHASTATIAQAPGGGPGMVWLNTDSNVYHCPGSQFYGKTKQGSYVSEADAKAKGAHADHNHPCTK